MNSKEREDPQFKCLWKGTISWWYQPLDDTHTINVVRHATLFIRKIYHRGVWLVPPLLSSQHNSRFALHHLTVQIIAFHHCNAYLQLSRCSRHHNPYWHNRWSCAGEHMVAIASLCNQIHYVFVGRQRLMFPYSFPIRYQRSLIWSGLKCLIMRYRAGVFSQHQIWLIQRCDVGLTDATFLVLSPWFENISAEGCFVTLKIAVLAHVHDRN